MKYKALVNIIYYQEQSKKKKDGQRQTLPVAEGYFLGMF